MVPSAFVGMTALPLTPNGKVDRRALPDASAAGAAGKAAGEEPRTLVERWLAGMWSELLGRQRIGTADGFFELGGHSLLGMQLVARIRKELGVELPLRALFEAPTLEGLAAAVEAAREARPSPPELPAGTSYVRQRLWLLDRGPSADLAKPVRLDRGSGRLALSFGQQRLWFLDRFDPGSAAYNLASPPSAPSGTSSSR